MPAVVTWNPGVPKKFFEQAKAGLAGAALTLRDEMRRTVSTMGPPPSTPGSPPRVATGTLLSRMRALRLDEGLRWRIGSASPHSHLLEFGTVKMAPRPFVRPSFDEVKPNMVKLIAKGVSIGRRA